MERSGGGGEHDDHIYVYIYIYIFEKQDSSYWGGDSGLPPRWATWMIQHLGGYGPRQDHTLLSIFTCATSSHINYHTHTYIYIYISYILIPEAVSIGKGRAFV